MEIYNWTSTPSMMELSKERALGKKSVNEPSLDSKRERVTACSITRSFCHIGSDWRDILRPHYL